MYEIRHYLTEGKKDIYQDWQSQLRDTQARIAIDRRIYRIELGNFGDHKPCREGVWNCVSRSAQVTVSTTQSRDRRSFNYSATEISGLRVLISTELAFTGKTGSKGAGHERSIA